MKAWRIAAVALAVVARGDGGSGDAGLPTVALRHDVNGRVFCTGVLVAPDRALTARHCLRGADDRSFTLEVAPDTAGVPRHVARAAAIRLAHADPRLFPLLDVAEITLDAPATSVRPARLAERAPAKSTRLLVAAPDRSVEGAFEAQWSGERIFGLATATFAGPGAPCRGDSGAGVYTREPDGWKLVGLVAGVWDGLGQERTDCAPGRVTLTDLTAYAGWLAGGVTPGPSRVADEPAAPGVHPPAAPASPAARAAPLSLCRSGRPGDETWLTTQWLVHAAARAAPVDPTIFVDCRRATARFPTLQTVRLASVADLSPLPAAAGLTDLTLTDARVTDWNPLAALPALRRLTIVGNGAPIQCMSLTVLRGLRELSLSHVTLQGGPAACAPLATLAGTRHDVATP